MTSFFQDVQEASPDVNFGLAAAFLIDPRPDKIDLIIGVYKNEQLKCDLLPSVREAKKRILSQETANYLPIEGSPSYCELLGQLLLGNSLWERNCEQISAAQTLGGTGALRVLAEFTFQEVTKKIFLPQPTWPNHRGIFERVGFVVESYSMYANKSFDFSSVLKTLKKAPPKSAVLFHASCHNPTGCDPSKEEWKELAKLIREQQLLPIFDCAYQGFGDGLKEDVEAIRLFIEDGIECMIAYSCSKNFSLYNQRVGALFILNREPSGKRKMMSQLRKIIRTLYSNPPAHGAIIVERILSDQALRAQWEQEVDAMRRRLNDMRTAFVEKMERIGSAFDFSPLLKQKGMFSLLDLEKEQQQQLIDCFGIYMTMPGRLSITGLNQDNLDRVVDGISSVLKKTRR